MLVHYIEVLCLVGTLELTFYFLLDSFCNVLMLHIYFVNLSFRVYPILHRQSLKPLS